MSSLHRALWPAFLPSLILLVAPASGQLTSPCPDQLFAENPPNHAFFSGGAHTEPYVPPPDPVQIRSYGLQLNETAFTLNLTLAAPPPVGAGRTDYYRYWLGFSIQSPAVAEEDLDVRIASTTTYAEGRLVGSNEMGNPLLATLPVRWDGAMVSVDVPLDIVRAAAGGRSIQVGHLHAASDGPHPSSQVQSPPSWQDSINGEEHFLDFRACSSTAAPSTEPDLDESQYAPTPGVAVGVGILLAARLRRRGQE